MIDPEIVDEVINKFVNLKCDYMSTEHPRTYPLGFAVEVFNFESIERSWEEAKLPSEREHVTPYLIKNKDLFKYSNYFYDKDLSHIRCTVDTDDDFKLIERIISKIDIRPIHLKDVLTLLSKEPSLLEINRHIKHDGYERSLKEDEEYLKNNNHEKNN